MKRLDGEERCMPPQLHLQFNTTSVPCMGHAWCSGTTSPSLSACFHAPHLASQPDVIARPAPMPHTLPLNQVRLPLELYWPKLSGGKPRRLLPQTSRGQHLQGQRPDPVRQCLQREGQMHGRLLPLPGR